MRGSVLKAEAMVGFNEKAALEQGPEGGEQAGRVGMMGREIQAEGTAGAQRQWWECLWLAHGMSGKPVGLEWKVPRGVHELGRQWLPGGLGTLWTLACTLKWEHTQVFS